MTKRVFDQERFDMWDIDGKSIENVIEHFQYEVDRLKDVHEGASDFSFSFDIGWSAGDSVEAYIHFMRDETSSETAKRLKKEEKAKAKAETDAAKKEAKERKEFERLKKKFG